MKRSRFPFYTTIGIIALNVVLFALFWIVSLFFTLSNNGAASQHLIELLALNPRLFTQGYVWTLVTSMFMHANFTHLLVNMISLFFLGTFVEQLIGKKRYLTFYLASGIIAGLFFVGLSYLGQFVPQGAALFGTIDTFAVGASGALFALGGLLAVLIPRMRVLVFFVIPMQLWIAMAVLMFGLWAISAAGGLPIGNSAHLGGLIAGLVYGMYLRFRYPKKVRLLNRTFGA